MKRILVTGASGCIGHYLTQALIEETDHELYLLVRNKSKLQLDTQARPGVTVLQGDMREISLFADLLKTIDIAVLTATAWGGSDVFDINVLKTIELLNLLNPAVCQQVFYFSTASLLDDKNQLLKEAGVIGHDYIRSKYECLSRLPLTAIAPAITILFPTLVLGGDIKSQVSSRKSQVKSTDTSLAAQIPSIRTSSLATCDKERLATCYPPSHLSAGLPDFIKWMDLVRFFKADGSFHFIHALDIAQVVKHLIKSQVGSRSLSQVKSPDTPLLAQTQSTRTSVTATRSDLRQGATWIVLGQDRLTVNQAVIEICDYLDKKIYFRIPLSLSLANLLILLFRIQMAPWDRFCLNNPHFTYQNPINPASFGLPNYCATLADVLKISGIPRGKQIL